MSGDAHPQHNEISVTIIDDNYRFLDAFWLKQVYILSTFLQNPKKHIMLIFCMLFIQTAKTIHFYDS